MNIRISPYSYFKLLLISLLRILSYHRLRQAQSPSVFSEAEPVEVGDYNLGEHADNHYKLLKVKQAQYFGLAFFAIILFLKFPAITHAFHYFQKFSVKISRVLCRRCRVGDAGRSSSFCIYN